MNSAQFSTANIVHLQHKLAGWLISVNGTFNMYGLYHARNV